MLKLPQLARGQPQQPRSVNVTQEDLKILPDCLRKQCREGICTKCSLLPSHQPVLELLPKEA